jgi:hypothetical protein
MIPEIVEGLACDYIEACFGNVKSRRTWRIFHSLTDFAWRKFHIYSCISISESQRSTKTSQRGRRKTFSCNGGGEVNVCRQALLCVLGTNMKAAVHFQLMK